MRVNVNCPHRWAFNVYFNHEPTKDACEVNTETGEAVFPLIDKAGRFIPEADAPSGALIWDGIQVERCKGSVRVELEQPWPFEVVGHTEDGRPNRPRANTARRRSVGARNIDAVGNTH